MGGSLENRAETTSRVSARTRHVIFGILQNARSTRNRPGADLVNSVLSSTTMLKGSLTTSRHRMDHSAVALLRTSRQPGCVLQDIEPLGSSSILRKGTNILKSTRKAKFALNKLCHIKTREKKGPSLGVIQPAVPHARSRYAPKFEDRSQEETEM